VRRRSLTVRDMNGAFARPLRLVAFICALLLGTEGRAAVVVPRPSAGCSAATLETGRELQRTIDVDGTRRAYILDVPDGIQAKQPVPLLFDFHGFGHSAAGVWNVSGFKALAARDGFIVVYPDGLPVHLLGRDAAGWEIVKTGGNRDLAFTARLLDHLERTYCIDHARVFATGFSNGAFFSYLLACSMADRFAAIAPVSGGQVSGACDPGRGVPVLIHHGRQDDLVPIAQARAARDAWVKRDGCRTHSSNGCERYGECRDGSEVEYCEGDFAHRWPPEATERIWAFFKAHPMPEKRVISDQ
jgi:polyhydroxybutyrate depolymerase